MSINWGEYEFSPIEQLDQWSAPSYGGIYAITFKKDPVQKPQRHTILYFGKAKNFSERGIGVNHHKYKCWKYHAYQKDLYISVHRVDREAVRSVRELQLITDREPVCNKD